MNKPATKEPSMDEILSSIRQIIADDDASVAAPRPASPSSSAPIPPPIPRAVPVPPPARPAPEPLALSSDQIVSPRPVAPPPARPEPVQPEPANDAAVDFASMLSEIEDSAPVEMPFGEPVLVDPEDIAFEGDPEPEPEPVAFAAAPEPVLQAPQPPTRPAAPVAQAAPMPDPTLSDDLAEQLIAPATDAAVQGAMARLGSLAGDGIGGMTVESMIRQMLKPMLKDWLDENLPALVERLVEREISRISRGVK